MHPMKKVLDTIWNAGHTPKLLVDATYDDVEIPDYVKKRWGARLPLDLNASYPLNVDFTEQDIQVDLAFNGHVARCIVPWKRIYAIIDCESGQGITVPSHAPKVTNAAVVEGAVAAPEEAAPQPHRGFVPRVIKGGKSN